VSAICAFCDGLYSEEEHPHVCPHCGADVDLTLVEPAPGMDDDTYEDFLADEGLGEKPPRRRSGCMPLLLLPVLLALAAVFS